MIGIFTLTLEVFNFKYIIEGGSRKNHGYREPWMISSHKFRHTVESKILQEGVCFQPFGGVFLAFPSKWWKIIRWKRSERHRKHPRGIENIREAQKMSDRFVPVSIFDHAGYVMISSLSVLQNDIKVFQKNNTIMPFNRQSQLLVSIVSQNIRRGILKSLDDFQPRIR